MKGPILKIRVITKIFILNLLAFLLFNSSVKAQLTGGNTYPINGVQNPPTSFSTVGRAFTYLNANGTTGAGTITLEITSGYLGDSGTIAALTAYPGMDPSRPIVLKPGSGQTPTISTAPAANSAVIRFNGARYFTIDGSNNGTNSRDLTITTSSTTATVRLVDLVPTASSSCKFITVKNVNLLGNSTTSAINTLYGIYLGSGTGTGAAATSGNDSNLFQNNLIEAVRTGIYLRGTNATGQYDSYNRVLDNIIGGTVAPGGSNPTTYFGGADDVSGIFMNSQQNALIQNNTIRNSRPANRYVRGIHLASLAEPGAANKDITVNANWIMNLAYSGTGAWANHGIRIQTNNNTASNIRITNNFISNIAADGDNLANSFEYAIAGIQMPSQATSPNTNVGIHIYNNTINLYDNGAQKLGTGTGRVAACIIMQTNIAGGIRILNNNLYNTYPGGSATNSRIVAIYAQNTTSNPLLPANNGSSNNNNLYVNGSNAVNHIGFLLNSNQTSFANWKSNSVDSASVNVDPQFLTNSAPYTYESSLNNVGAPAGVAQDIEFRNRNSSTPDIGATEFTPPAINIAMDKILNVASGCSLSQLDVQAQIKNLINAIPSGDTIAFWYKVGTAAKVWDSAFLSSSVGTNNTYQFSFSQPYVFAGPGSYTVWVGFSYNKDTLRGNDSMQISIVNATCLTGGTTYNINGTQNPPTSFATVADAFTHLNNNGVTGTGTITLLIASGYTGEAGVIPPLGAYHGMDASRPIVLKPASGQTPTITTAPAGNSAVIRFNGAKYFTIDGSNNGTNTRDLKISTSSTTTTVRLVDLVPTSTSACEFITVKNVHLLGNSTTSAVNTYAGIYLGSGTASPGAALVSGNDSNLFENNLIEAVRNGIWLQGTNNAGQYDQYNRILGNTVGGTVAPGGSQNTTYFGGANTISGIYLNSQQNALIQNNLVRNSVQANYYARGIHLEALSASGAANKDIIINANRIHSLIYAGTGEWANHGMRIQTNDNTGANILVTNNVIANIAADGFTYTNTPNFLIAGIQLASNASSANNKVGIKLYHNSVNLFNNGTQKLTNNPAAVGTACIVLEANVAGGVEIVNNILQNTYPAVAASNSKAFGIYVKNGTNNPFIPTNSGRSNHNNIYVNGSNTNNITGYILGADEVLLTDWQGNNIDSVSLNIDAQFINDITLYTLSADLNNKGTGVGVTKDIDDKNRNSSTPDLGVSEYNPPTYNIAEVEVINPTTGCNKGSETITVKYRNAGIFSIPAGDTIVFWYMVDTATAVADTLFVPVTVASGDSFDFSFTQPFVFTQNKKHTFKIYAFYNKDLFPENDTIVIEVENLNCISTTPTIADFETGDDGFTQTGGWVRGTPAKTNINSAGSGQIAWVSESLTGNYAVGGNYYLYSPNFDFSTACQPKLTWKMRYISENNWDALVLDVTTDNTNWTRVTSVTPAYTSTSGNGPVAPPKYSGNNNAWTTYVADLSAFANAPFLKFRFYFGSDNISLVYEGFAIDSVAVEFYPNLGNASVFNSLNNDTAFVQAPYKFTSSVAKATGVKHYWYHDNVLVDSVNAEYNISWSSTGTHEIKHIVQNCAESDTVIIPVTVVTPVGLPIVDFLANKYSLNSGETVNLTSITDNGVFRWEWVITPDMNYDYLSQNVVPTYSFSGNLTSQAANLLFLLGGKYDVCLIAENVNGIDTICKTQYIEVFDAASVCAFPSVPYPTAKIFDSGMGTGNYANNENCTAVIELECADTIYLKLNNLQTELNADYLRIYDGDEDPVNALWDISQYPNGLSGSLAGINNLPAVMKASNGYVTIRFTSNGSVPSQGFEIEYTSSNVLAKPSASFNLPDTSCPATPLQPVYTGATSGATTYRWDIDGDNANDYSGANPTFQYANAGSYTVRLVVSNCIGADTFFKTIVIAAPATKPATAFSADILNPIVGDQVTLTDLTSGCVQGVAWSITPNTVSFVKGTTASSKNPVVVFNATGCYDVKLVTWNGIGYDTLEQTCYINVKNTCTPQTQLNSDIGISRVALNTIDNQTTAGLQSYSNFTNTMSTVLVKGERYELTIERPTNLNNMSRRAWIDFDQDGTFSASEVVALENNAQTLQYKANIRVPRTALSGYTRMRVAAAFTSGTPSPCGGFIGEFEDYRIIIISDTVKPVITLTGANPISIERGRGFIDPGATAFDNADGDISGFIVTTGTVDTMAAGVYIISYDVTDSSGNAAFTVTRTVNVTPDTTKPVMMLNGNAHDTITVFSSYTDLGATATDLVDGNLDNNVTVLSNNLDSSKVGTYTITYTVSDLSGNIAFISRLVTVVDTVQPTIILTGNNPLIWLVKIPYVDPGHTVIDNYDTGLVATITGTVDYNAPGTYQLFFNVVDNSGDSAATVIRTVIVADTVKPAVTLTGPDTITMDVFTSYFELGATATDNYDVALPAVSVLGTVDTALVADQVLKYIVTDLSGNTSDTVVRIVKVVDRVAPVIVVHDPIVIQRTQAKPSLADSVDYSDNYYPKQQLTLNITENIDVNVEGYYTVEYTVSDPSGNVSQVAKGFVIVTGAVGVLPVVVNDDAISVYPNPAIDKAYVSMSFIRETSATVTVYSVTGQKVLEVAPQGTFTEKTVELDLSSLNAGQYFVRIEGSDGVVTKKLVITNR